MTRIRTRSIVYPKLNQHSAAANSITPTEEVEQYRNQQIQKILDIVCSGGSPEKLYTNLNRILLIYALLGAGRSKYAEMIKQQIYQNPLVNTAKLRQDLLEQFVNSLPEA